MMDGMMGGMMPMKGKMQPPMPGGPKKMKKKKSLKHLMKKKPKMPGSMTGHGGEGG